jgi:SAM-dependent methyltransferase
MAESDFIIVTERGGEPVSQAQVDRFRQRYVWAGDQCAGKDVLELACGTGPGLGYLRAVSRSLVAADVDANIVQLARTHYGDRVDIRQLDAADTGLPPNSFDVVILFEAIYYISDVDRLLTEVVRVLRPGGCLLIATANKDLFDFNPSPYSHDYYNPPELSALLKRHGFSAVFLGGSPVPDAGTKTRLLRWLKRQAVRWNLIPGSMAGKRLLKRLVFGSLVTMPRELELADAKAVPPQPIASDKPDTRHLVLYCQATKL